MENKPLLIQATFKFIQESNTNGTTGSNDEELEITMESVVSGLDNEGGFYVLRTNTGWSINNISDLKELFNQIENIKFNEDNNC